MASSTNRPMANTMANMVSMLIEKPSAARMPKVPSNTTGTAIVGIRVARKFCKKRYITANTKIMASINVLITLLIETFTNGVVSKRSEEHTSELQSRGHLV